MEMESSGLHKRHREFGDFSDELDSPESKRLRDDLLFDIPDDDAGAGDQDLASVIRILEEEMAIPSPPPAPQEPLTAAGKPDLGYLLEASDDELGLPPTAVPSFSADEGGESAEAEAGFGQIWCEEFDLGIRMEEKGPADGWFDYADEFSGPYDLSDLTWRPESLSPI